MKADAVDHRDAVGCKKGVALRAGKLVATCKATGRLPNNIISKALDSDRLDGLDSSDLIGAGVHTIRASAGAEPTIDRFFNNVNGTAPTIAGSSGTYEIDMGFDVTERFVLCSVDTNFVDTRDAVCTVSTPGGNTVRVRIWDTGTQSGPAAERNAEFWVIVFGP
jgi:hypothetical protein